MPNSIKYSTSAQTLALKKGNFWIGTGDVGKGPTSTTDYWNGIPPPSGGYTIYLNKASGGPSIYCPANDAALISLTNSIAGASYTTAAQCLTYFATQTDKMVFNIDYPAIVTNGLILNLDAGFTPSYPTAGTTWYDLSTNGNNGTLTNGPTYDSANNGSIVFDGIDDFILGGNITSSFTNQVYASAFYKLTATANYPMVLTLGIAEGGSEGFSLRHEGNNGNIQLVLSTTGSTQTLQYSPATSVVGQIVQVGLWYNGTTWKGYKNGVEFASNSITGNISFGSAPLLRLGKRSDGYYFPGNIYNAQIYNRALSSAEVLQNYNATKSRFGL